MQDKVIAANGMASRRAIAIHRQLILPVAVLLLISAGVLAALMQFNAGKLDREAEHHSRNVVEEALDVRARQLDRVVKDYAWWNEAVLSIELQRDLSWAEDRLGAVLYSTHAYDLAFVVAPDDTTFYASHNGVRTDVDIASALGNEFLAARGRPGPRAGRRGRAGGGPRLRADDAVPAWASCPRRPSSPRPPGTARARAAPPSSWWSSAA